LRALDPAEDAELLAVDTRGDRQQEQPVWEIGGQGVFVKEVQAAVLDGRADVAVHSAKDLPSQPSDGLVLAAVPVRADPRDVLVGTRLADLGPGAVIATGSVRRRAQLAWLRPDLTFTSLRGNISTRLGKIPRGGAVVMAKAALDRLDLSPDVVDVLPVESMLPQVAQGALAVECRVGDERVLNSLTAIDNASAHVCVDGERAFLARLGGGCDLPVGAYAQVVGPGVIHIEGMLASPDGRVVLRAARAGEPSVGAELADQLLDSGGRELIVP
jgi:hydroxymethylbilane synthase